MFIVLKTKISISIYNLLTYALDGRKLRKDTMMSRSEFLKAVIQFSITSEDITGSFRSTECGTNKFEALSAADKSEIIANKRYWKNFRNSGDKFERWNEEKYLYHQP